jgi:DNA-binding XRE family transcriptional regulator
MRTLTENGKTFVLVPIERYERLTHKNEDTADVAAFDIAIKRGEEAFPVSVFDAIDSGKNPIKVFREHRGIRQNELATSVGVAKSYMSQLESGKREGGIKVILAISDALKVPMELLV